jgi:hypothetical protein
VKWVGLDDFVGINTTTRELVVQGHWHGVGGSGAYEWSSYSLESQMLQCTAYIDVLGDKYTIYKDGDYVDGTKENYDKIYSQHIAGYTPYENYSRYMLDNDSGLDNW